MNYGSAFNDFKEQIKMAITKSKIVDYTDENGKNVYRIVTKDEAVERVIEIYDETIYHLEQFAACSRAIEKILKERCPDLEESEYLREYIRIMEQELQSSEYRYDSDVDEERVTLRNSFKVIDGGKKD